MALRAGTLRVPEHLRAVCRTRAVRSDRRGHGVRSDGKTLIGQPHVRGDNLWTLEDIKRAGCVFADPLAKLGVTRAAVSSVHDMENIAPGGLASREAIPKHQNIPRGRTTPCLNLKLRLRLLRAGPDRSRTRGQHRWRHPGRPTRYAAQIPLFRHAARQASVPNMRFIRLRSAESRTGSQAASIGAIGPRNSTAAARPGAMRATELRTTDWYRHRDPLAAGMRLT